MRSTAAATDGACGFGWTRTRIVYPVELTLWDAEVQALPGFDPDRRHFIATRTITHAEGDALLEQLRGMVVPIVPDASLLGGYGGELHEIRVMRGDCAGILRWWLEVPAGWSDAAAIAATLRAWIVAWRAEILAAMPADDPPGTNCPRP